ncbi:hypothetical protein [Shewanella aestuarii]|uniref:Uncharacterized protein n=1 Tax=Shewanella aestuarii TaxID=1028752 RepID=A0A6G9QHV1_9GAMM|nr:hypothetical protein [Shewanella aestuarii]QIR14042.1 hypothetical protein HBH39_05600 [Shewanella aestuarii]
MKQFISQCLLIFIMFTTYALANDMEQQEIVFRENPQTLYEQLMGSAQPPFSFTNLAEFEQLANQRNLSSTELIQQMILLARLNLETNLYIDTKYDDAQTLIDQLDIVVTTL